MSVGTPIPPAPTERARNASPNPFGGVFTGTVARAASGRVDGGAHAGTAHAGTAHAGTAHAGTAHAGTAHATSTTLAAPSRLRRWSERPRWQRMAASAAAALLTVAAATALWWGPRALATLAFFHVRAVRFEGVRFAAVDELMTRVAVDTTQSAWQSLAPIEARVAQHPMVRDVHVERDLPATLRVRVVERQPVAFVTTRGGLVPADSSGQMLPIDPARTALDIPVATRDSALLIALDGLRQGAPELFARIVSARADRNALTFVLSGSLVGAAGPAMMSQLVVRTPREVTVGRFRDILPVEADLARAQRRAVELDLRFRDQVIVRQP